MSLLMNTRVRAGDFFESLRGEDEQGEQRELELKGNPGLERIIAGFKGLKFIDLHHCMYDDNIFKNYQDIAHNLPKSKDITLFTTFLSGLDHFDFYGSKVGYYISALINKSVDKEFELFFNVLPEPIDGLGYRNTKKIIINGDVGDYLGQNMESGEIIVNGNGGVRVGSNMNGGKININNVTGSVGDKMKSGEINIFGFADSCVGHEMIGGTINLFGDYRHFCDYIQGGNIYHKGQLLVSDGKRTFKYYKNEVFRELKRIKWPWN